MSGGATPGEPTLLDLLGEMEDECRIQSEAALMTEEHPARSEMYARRAARLRAAAVRLREAAEHHGKEMDKARAKGDGHAEAMRSSALSALVYVNGGPL